MKTLLVLLIASSFLMGIPTNLGWFSLFSLEFSAPWSLIKNNEMSTGEMTVWILLLLSHTLIVSTFFLIEKPYFKEFMIFSPIIFIALFTIFDIISLFLLIPFVIVWLILIYKARRLKFSSMLLGTSAENVS